MMRKSCVFYILIVLGLGGCPKKGESKSTQLPTGKPLTGDEVKNTYQANVKVATSDKWLHLLGITDNAVVVNASNEKISFSGTNLNGALIAYAKNKGQTDWEELQLPGGSAFSVRGRDVKAGEFATSTIDFGKIYHAVGPRASQTSSLEEARITVQKLYGNMLEKANKENVAVIVLPAISTGIFATGGKGFTQEKFIEAIYQGMCEGIQAFKNAHPGHSLKIILNNWRIAYMENIPAL